MGAEGGIRCGRWEWVRKVGKRAGGFKRNRGREKDEISGGNGAEGKAGTHFSGAT
jgi:hypothetical protein